MSCACETAPNREAAMVVAPDGSWWCDPCIADLVAALNDGGIRTVASCCGHGRQFDPTIPGPNGVINLADGRELIVRAVS